jgi:hypothetical protein
MDDIDIHLSSDLIEMCEKDITIEECEKATSLMKSNKSPGEDGITAEFYKLYWHLIGNSFLEVINDIKQFRVSM